MWRLPNGKVTRVPKGIQIGDVKYPASIFRRWPKEELNKIGIYPYREVKFDQKWLKSTGFTEEEIDGEIVKTHTTVNKYTVKEAKEIKEKELKERLKSEIREWVLESEYYDAIKDNQKKKEVDDFIVAKKNKVKADRDLLVSKTKYKDVTDIKYNDDPEPPEVLALRKEKL
jgi:hypothetical protein